MVRSIYRTSIYLLLGCLNILIPPSAHSVHKGAGDLPCGTCHTMHNSQGGMEIGGNAEGSFALLRAPVSDEHETHNLCLKCHASNGEWASVRFNGHAAPKVYIAGQDGYGNNTKGDDANFSFFYIGAGGDFSRELSWNGSGNATDSQSLGYGHSLGQTNVTPPGSGSTVYFLSCTACHDPHGNRQGAGGGSYRTFRYLRALPRVINLGGNSYRYQIVVDCDRGYKSGDGDRSGSNGSTGATLIWAVAEDTITGDPVNDTGKTNYYCESSSQAYVKNMGRWCAICHRQFHEELNTSNLDPGGLDWLRHPAGTLLDDGTPQSGSGATIVDTSTYTQAVIQAGKALPVLVPRNATDPVYYLTDESTNRVFCLSCHFAHGGPYYDALRWNYTSSVSPGGQEGRGVPSDRGCQLCHNR